MQLLTTQQLTHLFSTHLNCRFKQLFSLCLVISTIFHVVTILSIISSGPARDSGSAVNFIDLSNDISSSSSQMKSVINETVKQPELQEPVQSEPPDRQNTIDSVNSDPVNSTENSSNDAMSSTLGLGMANGFFSSLGDGRSLRPDIHGYYFELLEAINFKWWQKSAGLGETARQDGIMEILIGRNGELLDVKLINSTGSRKVDQAIIDAVAEAAPFPALPASYEMGTFHAPLKISKPSHFFAGKNMR